MERWADPHTAPHRGLLPVGAGAVLAAQNPWGHTLSWSQPTHFWVTASYDPRRDIPFIMALLPESRVLYVSAPPPLSLAWGWPHLWNVQVHSW